MSAVPILLTVDVDDDDSNALIASGEIYPAGGAQAVVTHVTSSPTWPTGFCLDPGQYEYRFHIEAAGGSFTITLKRRDDGASIDQPGSFTTADGAHFTYAFEVKS